MEEMWRIVDVAPKYEVYNLGRIRKKERNGDFRYYKKNPKKGDYVGVSLRENKKYIITRMHRLVAKAFVENPNNHNEVNHKDDNKHNNCADNLEWCNHGDNIRHSFAMGLVTRRKGEDSLIYGDKNPASRMVINVSSGIFYSCVKEAAKYHNIPRTTLSAMLNGWRHNWSEIRYA